MSATIPLTVLTGFLGAGKTTLLNHLVRQPELAGCAVLINEFGEVGIDHLLVEKLDDNLVLMESGCLCCTVRGDLTRSLRDLFMRSVRREIAPLSRVIVETTGLADPAPVIYTLIHDFFIAERFRLDGIVTAVDATHAEQQLARQFEAVKQVAMADRLLLTKCDLASSEQIERIERRLARLNPGAPRIRVEGGRVDPADLLDCGLYDPATKNADVGRWLAFEATAAAVAHEGHGHDVNRHGEVESFALRFAQPVGWGDFSTALDMLQTTVGERHPARQGDRQCRRRGCAAGHPVRAPRALPGRRPARLAGRRPLDPAGVHRAWTAAQPVRARVCQLLRLDGCPRVRPIGMTGDLQRKPTAKPRRSQPSSRQATCRNLGSSTAAHLFPQGHCTAGEAARLAFAGTRTSFDSVRATIGNRTPGEMSDAGGESAHAKRSAKNSIPCRGRQDSRQSAAILAVRGRRVAENADVVCTPAHHIRWLSMLFFSAFQATDFRLVAPISVEVFGSDILRFIGRNR